MRSRSANRVIDRAGSLKRAVTAAFGVAAVVAGLGGIIAPGRSEAQTKSGAQPVRVIDGDGLKLGGVSVRLWGIDAPELRQECSKDGLRYPCGKIARDNLETLIAGQTVECAEQDRDRYGRVVAICTAGGVDLAGWMVSHGWALDWPKYSGGRYSVQQDKAEDASLGLWAGFFAAPWDWRKEH